MGEIDPAKLATKLEKLFGAEYEVYVCITKSTCLTSINAFPDERLDDA